LTHGDICHAAADAKTGELVHDLAKHVDLALRAVNASDRLWHYQQAGHMAQDLFNHAAAQADECTHNNRGCAR
jgi:hypothetical protein